MEVLSDEELVDRSRANLGTPREEFLNELFECHRTRVAAWCYRMTGDVDAARVRPETFLNFREAAFVLGVRSNIVRGLVAQGLFGLAAGYRNGLAKLIAEKEVQLFADTYVSTSVLARRFRLNSSSLARHLKESGTPLLAIPNPDVERGQAFFLRKDVAVQIKLPSRRMLREEAQSRMKADRKKKWAEYRQARESAEGKPMRRVRADCRHLGTGVG